LIGFTVSRPRKDAVLPRGTETSTEITAPSAVTISELNGVLKQYGVPTLNDEEWALAA